MAFGSSNRKVSKREFDREVQNELYSAGFNKRDRNEVRQLFRGDLTEGRVKDHGIDPSELQRGIDWLEKNPNSHQLSSDKVSKLKEILEKKL